MTDLPPAGWYADPEDPSQQRYWDGSAWTAHRTPATPATPQAPSWGAQPAASSYLQPGPETSGAAIGALVMGILSVVACLGPITGVPAMIVGRRAARDIDASHGAVAGRGLATGGVVTGLVGTLLWVLAAAFFAIALFAFSTDSTA